MRQTLDETATVVSAQDYYPFGGIMENRSYVTGSNINDKYKPACRTGRFTEKERDTETNYDYFGARYYDSELGRWLQVDPRIEKYPNVSPCSYVFNNPLRYTDPYGDTVNIDPQLLKPVV
ncbi:MAG: RHS repeat-associated core domain-containing protein [Ignavibacteria bacterium]|nr:RHS repeat-associated core domain-containing protein [Ignavibacteria bacterium]